MYPAVNMYFSAEKLGILTWSSMRFGTLLEPVSSDQSMNCSLSHFRVGFTREIVRLPLGLNEQKGTPLELETGAPSSRSAIVDGWIEQTEGHSCRRSPGLSFSAVQPWLKVMNASTFKNQSDETIAQDLGLFCIDNQPTVLLGGQIDYYLLPLILKVWQPLLLLMPKPRPRGNMTDRKTTNYVSYFAASYVACCQMILCIKQSITKNGLVFTDWVLFVLS